jgi:hypothetical protein
LFYPEEEIRNKNTKKDATPMYATHSNQDEDSQLHDLILVALVDWFHQSSSCITLGIVCFLILLCFFLSPPAWVVVPLRNLADAALEGRGDRDCFKERFWDGPIFMAVGFATKIICCKQRVSSFIPDEGVVVTK